ncbi:MAG: tripartite tricarboxylate transporter substrate binding protein, partial [Pseudomonadota bacterium]|nr:tripartite tricarboxylate transporter substrate binding protein [Pseudomonadota bacterium]
MGRISTTLAALTLLISAANADYPERPIDYVIPFGAGGESGITARLQQSVFKTITGQDIVVKYRPGGGGAVAWSQLNAMTG